MRKLGTHWETFTCARGPLERPKKHGEKHCSYRLSTATRTSRSATCTLPAAEKPKPKSNTGWSCSWIPIMRTLCEPCANFIRKSFPPHRVDSPAHMKSSDARRQDRGFTSYMAD